MSVLAFVRLISLRGNLTKAIYETEGEIEFHDIRQVTDQDFRQLRGQVDIICGGFSLVKHFHSQADDWDLRALGELSSLRLLERLIQTKIIFIITS